MVEENAFTKDHPVETSIGFTIVTTTRKFHLFTLSMDTKMKFLYSFSSLRNIPERPNFSAYHKWFSNYSSQVSECTSLTGSNPIEVDDDEFSGEIEVTPSPKKGKVNESIEECKNPINSIDSAGLIHGVDNTKSKLGEANTKSAREITHTTIKQVVDYYTRTQEQEKGLNPIKEENDNKEEVRETLKNIEPIQTMKTNENLIQQYDGTEDIISSKEIYIAQQPEILKMSNVNTIQPFDRCLIPMNPFACADNDVIRPLKEVVRLENTEEEFKAFLAAKARIKDRTNRTKSSKKVNPKQMRQRKARQEPKKAASNFDYVW